MFKKRKWLLWKDTVNKKCSHKAMICSIACLNLTLPIAANAQSAFNLDLSSVEKSIVASDGGSITIGNNSQQISAGDKITVAESIALQQSLAGGQTLVISERGNATGGTINIDNNFASLNNLFIPQGVMAYQTIANLSIAGNLTNDGSLFASPIAATTASISAANIYNNAGALISTISPSQNQVSNSLPINLAIFTIADFINAGQIISSGNLSINAGGNIVNSLPDNIVSSLPLMQAAGDLNLVSGLGQIVNQGIINSINANVNIDTIISSSISVNNLGGQILANLGAVNIRDEFFTEKFDVLINGGSILSDQLNIWSGTGNVNIDVTDITSQINVSAGTAHVLTSTPDLRLGTMNIVGDPTFFNMSGNIAINNQIATNGNALAIIAQGNITSNTGASINTTSGGGAGGNLLMLAGVNFTTSPSSQGSSQTSAQGGGNGDVATTLTVTGGSTQGGNIDLSNLQMLSTAASAGAGGNVTLVAFAGSSSNGSINTKGITFSQTATGTAGNVISVNSTAGFGLGERVILSQAGNTSVQTITAVTTNASITVDSVPGFFSTGTVTANGIQAAGGGGPNGNVVLISGATSGRAIFSSDIYTDGKGTANGGQIVLMAATPSINSATPLTILNGIVTAGNIFTASASSSTNSASISVGNLRTNSAPITIVSGANVTLSGLIKTGGNPSVGAIGPGGQLAIFAPGNITSASSSVGIDTSGSILNNNGGNVLLLAGSALSSSYSHTFGATDLLNLSVTTGAITGGNIDFTGGGSFTSSIFSTKGNQTAGPGTYGGNVQIVALASGSTGIITLPTGLTITTGGLANGNAPGGFANQNGNVTILAGASSGSSISLGNIDTTGSNAGAGNITILTSQASLNGGGNNFAYQVVSNTTNITTTGSISIPTNTSGQPVLQTASASLGNLTAAGGSVPIPPTGNTQSTFVTDILVQAGQNLSIGSVINANNSLPAGIVPGGCQGCLGLSSSTINILAGATLNFVGGPATVSSNAVAPNPTYNLGVDGGLIVINAQSLTGQANISANGTSGYEAGFGTGGNGGSISITSTGTSSDIIVGAANLTLSAVGDSIGNGGKISLSSGRDITVDPAAFSAAPQAGANKLWTPPNFLNTFVTSGNGAIIDLNAGRNLFISNNFSADGSASGGGNPGGNGGIINITVNSSSVFEVGAATSVTNGIQGTLTANAGSNELGNGGSISIKNLGSGGVQIDAGNPLQVNADDATATYQAGSGGNISLQGSTVLSSSPLSADGGAANNTYGSGNGGSVSISVTGANAPTFIVGTPTTNGVTTSITASGNIAGSGPPPVGPPSVPAPSYGNGGTISISNQASGITIDNTGSLSVSAAPANSNTNGGTGGKIILSAPNGPVLSQSALQANGGASSTAATSDGGPGGVIKITSNDPSNPFIVGNVTSATSGVSTSITATGYSGGIIEINSLGPGGIQIGANALSVAVQSPPSNTQAAGNGGSITLNAAAGPLAVSGDIDVSGGTGATPGTGFNFGGNGGSITLITNSSLASNNPFTIGSQPAGSSNYVSGALKANGGFGIAGNGFAGNISVKNLAGSIDIGANSLQVIAPDATTSGYAGDGGNIDINANGAITSGALSADGGKGFIGVIHYAKGFAGSVSLTTNSSTVLHLGGTGPGSVASVSASGWNGGNVTLVNNGSGGIAIEQNSLLVTAQAADLSVSPTDVLQFGQRNLSGPGGTVVINAPNGPVALNGDINVLGGAIFEQQATNVLPIMPTTTTLSVASTNGFAIGQEVLISNGTTSEWSLITNINPGVSITVNTLNNTYNTTPTISTYYLEQFSSSPIASSTQVTSTNPAIAAGATEVDVADNTGFQPNQQVFIYNPSFSQLGLQFSQTITDTLPLGPATGTTLTVNDTSGFNVGQTVNISGPGETIAGGENKQLVAPITPNTSISIASALAGTYPGASPTATVVYIAGTTIIDVADTSGFAATQVVNITGSGSPAGTETATIQSVGTNTITLTAGLANSYTGTPTISTNSVSQTMTISSLPASKIQFTAPVNDIYVQPVTVVAANHILPVPSSQGFVVNQAVNISSGSTSENQFITGVNSPTANTITIGQLTSNYPNGATVRVGSLAGQVFITAGQAITQAAGASIRANSVNITATSGSLIGSATNPIQTNLQSGLNTGSLSVNSPGASVFINNTSTNMAITSLQALSFAINSNGNIFVNGPLTSTGGGVNSIINTNTTFGAININNGPADTANNINTTSYLLIQNNNLAGAINFASKVNISSNGLTISSGTPPITPVAGTLPANVTVNPVGSPSVFFGSGLTANGPVIINAGSNAGNIIFNGTNAGIINFAGGLVITSTNKSQVSSTQPPTSTTTGGIGNSFFLLPTSLLAFGNGVPFGTIIPTDQTPESNPEKSNESSIANNNNVNLIGSMLDKSLKGQLFYLDRGLPILNGEESPIHLANGNAIVFASKDTQIQAGLANISIKQGSAVMILQTNSELAVLNLHDERRGAVTAKFDGQSFEVPVGRQITVSTKQNPSFDKINPSSIAYRELSSQKIGNKHVFFAEFSPLTAITSVAKWLSPEDKYHQQIAKRMLKTAAAIYVMGQQAQKSGFKKNN